MNRPILAAFLLLSCSLACKTTGAKSSVKNAESPGQPEVIEALPMAVCPAGELHYFRMVKAPGEEELKPIPDDYYFRMDVCLDGETATLIQVIRSKNPSGFDLIKPNDKSRVNGLFEAMTGDYSKLDISIPYKSGESFSMQGPAPGKGNIAQTAGYHGLLEYEKPLELGACTANSPDVGRLDYGTVTIEWRGKNANWCGITITDSAADLGQRANVAYYMEFDFKGFNEVTREKVFHQTSSAQHNCDTIWFKTDYAEYAFGPADAGCEKPAVGSYAASPNNFRIKYAKRVAEGALKMNLGKP